MRDRNMGDVELSNPPADGISSLAFSPQDPSALLVASWDNVWRTSGPAEL